MKNRTRALIAIAAVIALLMVAAASGQAGFRRWHTFGAGFANAGYANDNRVAVVTNGDGLHAGQLRIASSTRPHPEVIRLRVTSYDADPVPVDVWYLWIGCEAGNGEYWSRDLSGTIPTFTPPATFKIYDRRTDGTVDGCHVNVEMSTSLYDDGLHQFAARLQARHRPWVGHVADS